VIGNIVGTGSYTPKCYQWGKGMDRRKKCGRVGGRYKNEKRV